jgi:Gpi18-like mannosyltransferase
VRQRLRPAASDAPPKPRSATFIDLSQRLGGRLGRHAAQVRGGGLNLWVFALATMTWLITLVRQFPCRQGDPTKVIDSYAPMCYSDIGILYRIRGHALGQVPYLDFDWEYPVLSGAFAEAARRITDLLGFKAGPDLDAAQTLANANVYFAVTAVGLFACFLGIVAVQRRLMGSHPWGVAAVAAAPAVMTTGIINWDLFAVLLCSLGLLAWTRDRPIWSGVWLGLGVAAKLYPIVIIGGLFVLCWRSRRLVDFLRLLGASVVAWLVVNLPLMIAKPDGWLHFYTFNQGRAADLGSIWYALNLVGLGTVNAQSWALGLMVVGYAGIALLTLLAPVRPRLGQIAYLCVALMVSLNLVYSPQYVLWTLPLIVWARPVWRDIATYVVAELIYFVAIWDHLGHFSAVGPPRFYVIAVFIRVAATWWLMARVVRDVWRPTTDPSAAERDLTPAQRAQLGVGPVPAPDTTEVSARAAAAEPLFHPKWAPALAIVGWVFSRLTLIFTAFVVGSAQGKSGLDAMMLWDSQLFATVAEQGYPLDNITRAAQFPGLPLLLRALHLVGLPYVVGGLILSLVGSALVAWGLYRLAHGGVAGAVTVLAWCLAPMAVFSVVPYSESLFLACAVWAWLKARDDQWYWVALLAAAACTFRVSGLFLVGALVLFAVWGYGRVDWKQVEWPKIGRRVAWLSPALLVLAAYVLYLRFHYGTWGAWMEAQSQGWSRSFHWPWEGLRTTLCAAHWDSACSAGYDSANAVLFSAEILAVALGVLITVVCLWRRRVAEAGWVGVQVVAFTFQIWFMSVARAVLLWFPVWTTIGEIAGAKLSGRAWRVRLALMLVGLALSVLLMVAWAVRFYTGAWAG